MPSHGKEGSACGLRPPGQCNQRPRNSCLGGPGGYLLHPVQPLVHQSGHPRNASCVFERHSIHPQPGRRRAGAGGQAWEEFFLREALQELAEPFDFILLDCPPSLGLVTVNALCASTELMVPLQCEYYAMEGMAHLMRTYDLVRKRLNDQLGFLGVVLTMYDVRNKLSHQPVQGYFSKAAGFGKRPWVFMTSQNGSASRTSLSLGPPLCRSILPAHHRHRFAPTGMSAPSTCWVQETDLCHSS